MASSSEDLLKVLERQGYLSLSDFIRYLKFHAPQAQVSYPTAIKLVKKGSIRTMRVGHEHRVLEAEVRRFTTLGNYNEDRDGNSGPVSYRDTVSPGANLTPRDLLNMGRKFERKPKGVSDES